MKPRTTDRGGLVDVSVTVSPSFDKDGAVVGASSITRDISRDGTDDYQRRYKHYLEIDGAEHRHWRRRAKPACHHRKHLGEKPMFIPIKDLDRREQPDSACHNR